jgi:NADH dehydrogenase
MAQGAIQSGRYAAGLIAREVRGDTQRAPFRYKDKGSMAAIGRSQAVVQIKGVERAGFVAWLMWWVVHIALLISFRNRFAVMWQWVWSYVTFQRGARLITGPIPQLPAVTGLDAHGEPALPPDGETVALRTSDR